MGQKSKWPRMWFVYKQPRNKYPVCFPKTTITTSVIWLLMRLPEKWLFGTMRGWRFGKRKRRGKEQKRCPVPLNLNNLNDGAQCTWGRAPHVHMYIPNCRYRTIKYFILFFFFSVWILCCAPKSESGVAFLQCDPKKWKVKSIVFFPFVKIDSSAHPWKLINPCWEN